MELNGKFVAEIKILFMFDLNKPISSYLTEKSNITKLIIFTAAFALVFINFYSPFGVDSWMDITRWELLAYSSIVILTGVLVVVISRIVMYRYSRKKKLNYWQYMGWIAAEIFFMAVFYTWFEHIFMKGNKFVLDVFKITVQNTALVLLLPYSALWLYFSWQETNQQLKELSKDEDKNDGSHMIPFPDEKGILRFSIKQEDLLYLEAADNYVLIHYLKNNKKTKYLLRNTLKRLEDILDDTGIIRCHRSFMVNFNKVNIMRREKDGLVLELEGTPSLDILVSKTYADQVLKTFAKYC